MRFKDEEIDESQLTPENLANVRVRQPDRRVGDERTGRIP